MLVQTAVTADENGTILMANKEIAQIFRCSHDDLLGMGMAKQIQGTGLGPFVCKAIIDGHGSDIIIESVENERSTVTITLPEQPGSAERRTA